MARRKGDERGQGIDHMDELLPFLRPVARAIAATIGPRCEVVIHDIEAYDRLGSTIVHIENGHVTGRKVGGPTTNLGLEALRSGDPDPDRFNYRSFTRDGRALRSSSVYFRNQHGKLIGALCINFDVFAYDQAREALDELLGNLQERGEVEEVFGADIGEVLDGMVEASIARTGKPVQLMDREDKVAVLRELDRRGAFLVKRAVERVSRALGISRVTAYAYLDEARNSQPGIARRPRTSAAVPEAVSTEPRGPATEEDRVES
ncbi:MAG TPA: helix-turn-helix transcriptional regulator [Candidatus Dormibacteraeota bacterium]|nr:helix-turn-helix transcriptional regulator [Candidatus Dormibacteraeota bacterium]